MDEGVGAEVVLAPEVDELTGVDDVAVVVGAAEPPPLPHAGDIAAMPKTASTDTARREENIPLCPRSGGVLEQSRDETPQNPKRNVVNAPDESNPESCWGGGRRENRSIAAPLGVGAQHGDQLAEIKSARTAKFFDQSLVFSPRTTM
jgi:hypothetical protein